MTKRPRVGGSFVGRWRYETNQLYYEMEVTAGIYNLFYSVKDTLGNELWCGVTFPDEKRSDKLISEELDTGKMNWGSGNGNR